MGQSLRQRFNPKSITPKLKPLARPMLYLSLGLHGLLLLIPINVPEPPEPDTASVPNSLDRVSIANLAPSAPEDETSAPEPSPEPAPAPETPTSPPPQAAAPAPAPSSSRPTPAPETSAPAPEAAEAPPPVTPTPEPAEPPPSEPSEPEPTAPSSDAGAADPVVPIEGPPPPPEPLSSNSSANGNDAYEYNPNEVAQAGDEDFGAFNLWHPWWETVSNSGNFEANVPGAKTLSLPHTANVCLAEPPKVATLGVVVDETGEVVGDPDLLSGTGYAVLNDQAIELAKEYEFSPPDNTMEAYVFRVAVDYDAENCVEPES